jgi:hypothetical protein
MFGERGSGRGTARLYLNGYVFHSDPDLSDQWDALGEDQQRFFEHAFRQYEGKVRLVFIELKRVIDAAGVGGKLSDEPLDLDTPGEREDRDRAGSPAEDG